MFDIGWSEMAIVALLALVVIGPKDLPRVMRTMGHWVRKLRSLSREFQSGLDDMLREADLEEARKAVKDAKNFNPNKILEETLDPTGTTREALDDVRKTAESTGETEGRDALSEKIRSGLDERGGRAKPVEVAENTVKAVPETSEGDAADNGAADKSGSGKTDA